MSRERYARRLSAPLFDRFDIAVRVDRPEAGELVARVHPASARRWWPARVAGARRRAVRRGVACNADLSVSMLEEMAPMSAAATSVLERNLRSGALSARGLHRVHRLARTVADLEGAGTLVQESHVREAILLRSQRELLLGGDGG